MNLSRRNALLLTTGAMMFNGTTNAQDSLLKSNDSDHAALYRVHACSTSQRERLSPLMKAYADAFESFELTGLERNPRCCVWFEIVASANPGSEGWFVWHATGGTIFTATNLIEMRKAIDALDRIAKTKNGFRTYRVGITTSFPVTHV